MSSRQALDSKASGIMFGLCILWGLQQVVLKLAATDISAVMQIALRSGLSALMVYPMIKLAKGTSLWGRDYLPAGVLVGLLFAAEFFSGRASFTFYLRGAYRSFAVYRTYFCRIGSALEITL